MFEHMAFKGTDRIGTKDYAAEKAALDKVEEAYAAYDRERRRPVGRDEAKVEELEKAWKDAIAEADRYVNANEFGEIIDREGGVGSTPSPAPTRPATSTRCPPTGSSCGPTWSRSAS